MQQAEAQYMLYTTRLQMVVLLLARREPQDAQKLADRIGAGDDIEQLRAEARELRQRHPLADFDAELARLSALCVDQLRAFEDAGAAVHDAHAAVRAGEGACANVKVQVRA